MFGVNHLVGFGAARAADFEFAFMADYYSTANLNSYSFSGVPLGDATPRRHIIVAISARDAGLNAVNTVTIGGVAATRHISTEIESGLDDESFAIFSAIVPLGAFGTVVVGMSSIAESLAIGVWRAVRSNTNITPVGSDIEFKTGNGTIVLTGLAGGSYGVAAAVTAGVNNHYHTYVDAVEEYDRADDGALTASGASFGGQDSVTFTFVDDALAGAVSWNF